MSTNQSIRSDPRFRPFGFGVTVEREDRRESGVLLDLSANGALLRDCLMPPGNATVVLRPWGGEPIVRRCTVVRTGESPEPWCAIHFAEPLTSSEFALLLPVAIDQYQLLCRCSQDKDLRNWNSWRSGEPDVLVRLEGANLASGYLRGADLRKADLARANLAGTDLKSADLREANLDGANLAHADLTDALLIGASLRRANLHGACLRNAMLQNAKLAGANLVQANLELADLAGADLTKAELHDANLRSARFDQATSRVWEIKRTMAWLFSAVSGIISLIAVTVFFYTESLSSQLTEAVVGLVLLLLVAGLVTGITVSAHLLRRAHASKPRQGEGND